MLGTYTDTTGRVWEIKVQQQLYERPGILSPLHLMLATWENKFEYLNIAVFAHSGDGRWRQVSVDSAAVTAEIREAYMRESDAHNAKRRLSYV
jgi:hypothetical protein